MRALPYPCFRYGDSSEGYLAFVEDQIGAFERCINKQKALATKAGRASSSSSIERRCALVFESLGYEEERVFYHCDQVMQ